MSLLATWYDTGLDFHVSSAGKWTVKVHGHWLTKWNDKRGCYDVTEFRSKAAAEKAGKARLAANRTFAPI